MSVAVSFYHLTRIPLEKALPKLLEKVLARKGHAVVIAPPEKLKTLDDTLWTYHPNSFLPHGIMGDGREEDHPICLTDKIENPNEAEFLFITGGCDVPDLKGFTHCLYVFDGHNESELAAARTAWKSLISKEYTPKYWQQKEDGSWEEKIL